MEEKINLLYIGTNRAVFNQLAMHPRLSVTVNDFSLSDKEMINGESPDIIICERSFENHDGFVFYRKLKEHPLLMSLPFIMIATAYEEGMMKSALEQGIDDVYVLPLPSNEDLVSRIDFLLRFKKEKQNDQINKSLSVGYKIPLIKRMFDIAVASLALILLSPILLLVMIAIRLESNGKVYYTSTRVGRKPFNFYKFRSMRDGADMELKNLAKHMNQYKGSGANKDVDWKTPCPCSKKENFAYCSPLLHTDEISVCDTWYVKQKSKVEKSKPPFIKIPDDPRVTRVGKILRNTSIDELPQLINVIKGDMSIVGNRPLPLYEAEKLTNDMMAKRFLAPAGLTGLWQVEKRGRKGPMSDEERKLLDNRYAELFINKKYSFFYDIKLIMKTLPVIVQKESV